MGPRASFTRPFTEKPPISVQIILLSYNIDLWPSIVLSFLADPMFLAKGAPGFATNIAEQIVEPYPIRYVGGSVGSHPGWFVNGLGGKQAWRWVYEMAWG